jgi:hypothetical protein
MVIGMVAEFSFASSKIFCTFSLQELATLAGRQKQP